MMCLTCCNADRCMSRRWRDYGPIATLKCSSLKTNGRMRELNQQIAFKVGISGPFFIFRAHGTCSAFAHAAMFNVTTGPR
jgi:hypothetical protein